MSNLSESSRGPFQQWLRTKDVSRTVPCSSVSVNYERLPVWLCKERFQRAQKVIQQNFVSIFFSHLCGLLMIIQLPDGLFPLLVTGKSRSLPELFKRYLSTMLHVKSWYESDPFDPSSPAYKSLRQVRSGHARLCEKMNKEDPTRLASQGKVWVSQHDMVLTQWSFIGLALQFPKKCGLHLVNEADLEEINYAWRVLGYLNGIDDQFNMCSGSYEETRKLCRDIFELSYRPGISGQLAPLGHQMAMDIVRSQSVFFSGASGAIFLRYWFKVLNFEENIVPELTTTRDRFLFRLMSFVMNYALQFRFMRFILCFRLNYRLKKFSNERQRIVNKLAQEDSEEKYTAKGFCSLSSDTLYRDYFDVQANEERITVNNNFEELKTKNLSAHKKCA